MGAADGGDRDARDRDPSLRRDLVNVSRRVRWTDPLDAADDARDRRPRRVQEKDHDGACRPGAAKVPRDR
jgi:hypothetical protein